MSNFESRVKEPWTTYDNKLIQGETVFKSPYQKLCYMFLHSYSRAKKIFPSMPSIAIAICGSKRQAIEIVKQLEEMEFIEVIRSPGKPNNYILNDYFEIAEKIRSKEPVQDVHQCKPCTSADCAPVQDVHQTGASCAPVEPKPVQAVHPITKTKKEKLKNKISSSSSLAILKLKILSKLGDMNVVDIAIKQEFPEVPLDTVKEKMFDDIDNKLVTVENENQYYGLLRKRCEFWQEEQKRLANKTSRKPQFRSKEPIRKELLPDWFDEENEPPVSSEKVNDNEEFDLQAVLKEIRKK